MTLTQPNCKWYWITGCIEFLDEVIEDRLHKHFKLVYCLILKSQNRAMNDIIQKQDDIAVEDYSDSHLSVKTDKKLKDSTS